MAQTRPQVEGALLRLPAEDDRTLAVETPEWYDWLDQHTSFAFADVSGTFTARKERRAGGWYWKAYRRRAGKLASAYLGRSGDLSLERLHAAARALAGESDPTPPKSPELPAAPPARPADALLRTKLFMPRIRARRVARPRLLGQLRDDTQPLVLVAAPAGYGKTTLVVDWLTTDQRAAAWVSLEPGDNDPIHFWIAVATTLDMLQPGIGARSLSLLYAPQPPPIVTILMVLLNDLAAHDFTDSQGHPAHLVLDDYHLIEARAVNETVELLLDHLPPTLRLVIISRTDPALPLPALRVRNQLAEIRAADLAFTDAETADFLSAAVGASLDAPLAGALTARTEGWVAALQLVALSLRGHGDPAGFVERFRGSNRQLLSYLLAEVMNRQLAFVQTFLTHTSILDRMCAELCDAVLGLESPTPTPGLRAPRLAQAMLNHLDAANLFLVPLDAEGRWFRYHHLFAEALRDQLRLDTPELEPTLRRRAADWYEREGYTAEAIEQALVAQDWPFAARLIGASADQLWRRGEFGTLAGWLDRLPEALVREQPRLGFARACALLPKMLIDSLLPLLDGVEQGRAREAAAPPDALLVPPLATLKARALALRTKIARVLGDTTVASTLAHQALAALPPEDGDWRAETLVDLATIAYYAGQLREAQRYAAEATALAQAAGNYYLALYTLAFQALILHDRGRLADCEALLERARRQAEAWQAQDLAVMGFHDLIGAILRYDRHDLEGAERLALSCAAHAHPARLAWLGAYLGIFLALLRLAFGEVEAAHAALDQAEVYFFAMFPAGRTIDTWRQQLIAAWRARIDIGRGDRAAAQWVAAAASSGDLEGAPLAYWFYRAIPLALARARLALGEAGGALALLDQLRRRADREDAGDALLEILALRARALAELGRHGDAMETLATALALAEPHGYVQPFVNEGAAMAGLLQALCERQDAPGYARAILAACAQTNEHSLPHRSSLVVHRLVEPLSARELEILGLIAEGMSNREIADRLVIAEDTVKTHTKAIHGKLGVQRRTQAVARARELGLLQ
jgi:LuxR family maltose regulon positive regulatory protein